MLAPSWMAGFKGTLSVSGKGSFASFYQSSKWGNGRLELLYKNSYWYVQFYPEGVGAMSSKPTYERRLSSTFEIQGYLKERSFYQNFVQHGKLFITFGTSAQLQFTFEDCKRDEEMLKKISTVFEFFFSKNEIYTPDEITPPSSTLEELSKQKNIDKSSMELSSFQQNKTFDDSSISSRILKKDVGGFHPIASSLVSNSKTNPSPRFDQMNFEEENFRETSNNAIDLYSGEYVSYLMTDSFSNEIVSNNVNDVYCDEDDTMLFSDNDDDNNLRNLSKTKSFKHKNTPNEMNGILSPSKNNIMKNSTPYSSGKKKKFLTAEQCRRAKKDLTKTFTDTVENENSNNMLMTDITSTPPTLAGSFYCKNRLSRINNSSRVYDSPRRSPTPFNSQYRTIRNYSRNLTPKRECDSSYSTSLHASAKKLRLAKERDEKENSYSEKVGFANINSSCYMNATLQALLSFPFFINELKNEKYSNIGEGLLRYFLELSQIRFLNSNGKKTGVLQMFKDMMIKTSKSFSDAGRHEDAHEYYLSFKESLQKEIQQAFPDDKVVEDTLNVEMVETRMCPRCSKHSKNGDVHIQTHSELGIDIPEDMHYDDNFRLKNLIESTLKSSTVPLNCECGETHVDLLKRFSRLSKILVVHLHRYGMKDGLVEKNSSNITIPKLLDLKSFCTDKVKTPCQDKVQGVDRHKYHLQAVIEHLGSWASGGHYIARVQHENKWYRCDDQKITRMDEEITESCQQNAYLLFYAHSSYMNEVG